MSVLLFSGYVLSIMQQR